MTDNDRDQRSLVGLLRELPALIARLIRAEIDQIKADIGYKAKHFGVGAALIAIAAFVAIFFLGTLIATGILALSLVMPGWLAALIVSAALLLLILILVAIAIASFRRGAEPLSEETGASMREDMDAIKGMGKYDRT